MDGELITNLVLSVLCCYCLVYSGIKFKENGIGISITLLLLGIMFLFSTIMVSYGYGAGVISLG